MMRKAMLLTLLSVLALFACTDHRYPTKLVVADSLCAVNPDSALHLLTQYKDSIQTASKADRMYYELLTVKASDKADKLKPDADHILSLVDYYEHGGDKSLLPTAYYYAGRSYYELHDAPQALNFFLKTSNLLKGNYDDPLLYLTYCQTGYIYMYQSLYTQALEAFNEAYHASCSSNDTTYMIYGLRDLSIAQEAQDRHDEALSSLKKAHQLAKCHNDEYLLRNIEKSLAAQLLYTGNYQDAKKVMQPSLLSVLPSDSSVVYSIMTSLYKREGNSDSMLYYSRLLEKVGNIYAKDTVYKNLTLYYLKQGQHAKSKDYYSLFLICEDSLHKMTQCEAVAKAEALYNYQLREEKNALLEKENSRKHQMLWIGGLSFLSIIVSLLLYLWYYRKNQEEKNLRYQRSMLLKEKLIQQSKQQSQINSERITELERQIHATNSENDKLREDLKRERERLLEKNSIAKLLANEHAKASYIVSISPICQRFYQMANDALSPHDDDWHELESLLDKEFDHFPKNVRSLCRMSDLEYHTNLLLKIRLEPSRIARLLHTSRPNVTTTRSRLYKKVFGKSGTAEQWDTFILSL